MKGKTVQSLHHLQARMLRDISDTLVLALSRGIHAYKGHAHSCSMQCIHAMNFKQ